MEIKKVPAEPVVYDYVLHLSESEAKELCITLGDTAGSYMIYKALQRVLGM